MAGGHQACTWVMIQAELPALTGHSLWEALAPQSLSSPSLPKAKPPVHLPKCSTWAKKYCPSPPQCGTNWHLGGAQKSWTQWAKAKGKQKIPHLLKPPIAWLLTRLHERKLLLLCQNQRKSLWVCKELRSSRSIRPAAQVFLLTHEAALSS